jgi:hypothetical protein
MPAEIQIQVPNGNTQTICEAQHDCFHAFGEEHKHIGQLKLEEFDEK